WDGRGLPGLPHRGPCRSVIEERVFVRWRPVGRFGNPGESAPCSVPVTAAGATSAPRAGPTLRARIRTAWLARRAAGGPVGADPRGGRWLRRSTGRGRARPRVRRGRGRRTVRPGRARRVRLPGRDVAGGRCRRRGRP